MSKINITDFGFRFVGYGTYSVVYQSPKTSKCWSIRTTNMSLIDLTKNADNPTQKMLTLLKTICKRGY